MMFDLYSLNGAWEMSYDEQAYTGEENPWTCGFPVENAVPGYWEDMTDVFARAPFFCNLKITCYNGFIFNPVI